MVNFDMFMMGLLITSSITGLVTEAIKNILTEHNKTYSANTLAGIIALIVSGCVGGAYIVLTGTAFTTQIVVQLICLIFGSWLCSMVGYDKVTQAISQFRK